MKGTVDFLRISYWFLTTFLYSLICKCNMTNREPIQAFLSSPALQGILAIITLLSLLIGIVVTIKLDIQDLKNKVEANISKDSQDHPTFVTKEMLVSHEQTAKVQYDTIEKQLDWIQQRLGK